MATYTFATYEGSPMIPDNVTWTLRYNTMVHSSSLNGYTQTYELPGARWVARMDYTNLSRAETETLIAWLSRLRGMAGRFYLYDFSSPTTINGLSGVLGSVTSANTNLEDSYFTGTGLTDLEIGDNVSLTDDNGYYELKKIVDIQGSNYYIAPGWRRPVSEYASTYNSIRAGSGALTKMMLDSDDQATKAVQSKLLLGSVSISCVEIFSSSGSGGGEPAT